MSSAKTGIEVNVIQWNNGTPREVAITFHDLDQMVTIKPDDARTLAFLLMECADHIQPPFEESQESKDIFGPYEDEDDGTDEDGEDEK